MAATREQIKKISEWQKEHTLCIGLRLQRGTDADLVEAIENAKGSRMGEVKRLMRLGLETERKSREQE